MATGVSQPEYPDYVCYSCDRLTIKRHNKCGFCGCDGNFLVIYIHGQTELPGRDRWDRAPSRHASQTAPLRTEVSTNVTMNNVNSARPHNQPAQSNIRSRNQPAQSNTRPRNQPAQSHISSDNPHPTPTRYCDYCQEDRATILTCTGCGNSCTPAESDLDAESPVPDQSSPPPSLEVYSDLYTPEDEQ